MTSNSLHFKWLPTYVFTSSFAAGRCFVAGSGHNLNLKDTERRPGYKSPVETKYINTTDKCIALFYRMMGVASQRGRDTPSDVKPAIRILALDEERKEYSIAARNYSPQGT